MVLSAQGSLKELMARGELLPNHSCDGNHRDAAILHTRVELDYSESAGCAQGYDGYRECNCIRWWHA